jgi:hypothetical protein
MRWDACLTAVNLIFGNIDGALTVKTLVLFGWGFLELPIVKKAGITLIPLMPDIHGGVPVKRWESPAPPENQRRQLVGEFAGGRFGQKDGCGNIGTL